jgi:hypothetical protein
MDYGRPAAILAWIECESCGRIEKPAIEFNYPAHMAEDMQLFVWMPCERCGRRSLSLCSRWLPRPGMV